MDANVSNIQHVAKKKTQAKTSARHGTLLYRKVVEHLHQYWQLWAFTLPSIAFVVLFAYVPMYGVQLAFRQFDFTKGLTGGTWVGWQYFEQFFRDPMFVEILSNTFRISMWTLVMGFIAPIVLALLINQIGSPKVKSFVQTITYMPHFISTVVMVSIIQIFLAPSTGLLGRFLGRTSIMGDPNAFAPIYWISEVWQHAGWNCIIYLAALSSVDLALYEAARIDGAGRLQLIRYVDIPTIMPTVGVLLILNMGSVLGVGFEKVWLMQNTLNINASEVISTYTYRIGLLNNQFSYSTAIGLFNSLVNFLFLIMANFIAKRTSDTSIF
ncbi:MAG: ABC transporter permease subunit [Bifidobacterium aquikefiri]|mgnify:CR=1 FL=1|uniref:Sugar ABC transporter permease n=1 Tax=Bifidobacterium aquikefiri TaxID=1653207 RepID=A0A261G915_9BIFI|nr:ABC transporter permease subunit [Bifidobacterium aquikefiri]OZG67894.1 sugar ABC transporter permease [Bifidobacterium aquikefiri]